MQDLKDYVCRAQSGDHDAFGLLVRHFQDLAVGYAYSLLKDFHRAEDAAQEAFIVAFESLSMLKEPVAFPGWLQRIVFTRCSRFRRKDDQFDIATLDDVSLIKAQDLDPAEVFDQKDREDTLLQAIDALPERYGLITILFYISDYSQKEIADFLKLPLTTVEKRLQYARRMLKERMILMAKDNLQTQRIVKDDVFVDNVLKNLTIRKPQDEDHLAVGHLMREGVNLQTGRVWPYADSADYIKNTLGNNLNGCFIGMVGDTPVGQINTHTTGRVGFVGSIGVDRAHRGRGYGRALLDRATEYLQDRCDVIGVNIPANAKSALNLFYNAGFRETYPARQMEWGADAKSNPASVTAQYLRLGSQLDSQMFESVIKDVQDWSDSIYPGLDFSSDIRFFLHHYSDYILFYFDEDKPRGFLAVHDDYLGAEVWGAVAPCEQDEKVLETLICEKNLIDLGGMFRFNTFCRRLTDVFVRCGGRILDDQICMMFSPHRDDRLDRMGAALVLQSWATA